MFVGSPYFTSPEQARTQSDIDIRADIYSLGATLYYMVTGCPPFDGETALYVLQAHAYEQITWPADVNPDVSESACLLISKMMAKDARHRHQTPRELVRDIDSVLGGSQIVVRRDVQTASTVAPSGSVVAPRAKRPPCDPESRSRPTAEHRHVTREGSRPTTAKTVVLACAMTFVVSWLIFAAAWWPDETSGDAKAFTTAWIREKKERGYALEWQVCGPLPMLAEGPVPRQQAHQAGELPKWRDALPAEGTYQQHARYEGRHGSDVGWQRALADLKGFIDLQFTCNTEDDAIAVSRVWARASTGDNYTFKVGSDDSIAVRVNGAVVFSKVVLRVAAPDQDLFTVPLRKGWNEVVVKIANNGFHAWGFYFRVADARDRLTFSPDPPPTRKGDNRGD